MKVSVTGDVPETPELSGLERAVLAVALGDAAARELQVQAEQAEVVSRTYSGVGFLTKLRLPDDAPRADANARVGAVSGQHAGAVVGA